MDLSGVQNGIFQDIPQHGRFLYFQLNQGATADQIRQCLDDLVANIDGESVVLGLGQTVVDAMYPNANPLESLDFPAYDTRGVQVPSTPADVFLWVRGQDQGDVALQSQSLLAQLSNVMTLQSSVEGFKYKEGRDLTGYEDGTENPEGDEAYSTAFSTSPAGGSYLAIQKWQHDMASFKAKPQSEQDNIIGRELESNQELSDAPESAHVKRTEQEGFDPEVFLLRRSMPYSEAENSGLMFLSFSASPQAFNTMMAKMVGEDDGIVDALFTFSTPLTGAFFWCPPMKDGKIDLAGIS